MQYDNFGPMAKTAIILTISNSASPEKMWQLVARNEPNKQQIFVLMQTFFRNNLKYSNVSIGELKYVSMGGERKLYQCSVTFSDQSASVWFFTIDGAPLVSFEK